MLLTRHTRDPCNVSHQVCLQPADGFPGLPILPSVDSFLHLLRHGLHQLLQRACRPQQHVHILVTSLHFLEIRNEILSRQGLCIMKIHNRVSGANLAEGQRQHSFKRDKYGDQGLPQPKFTRLELQNQSTLHSVSCQILVCVLCFPLNMSMKPGGGDYCLECQRNMLQRTQISKECKQPTKLQWADTKDRKNKNPYQRTWQYQVKGQ